jgi:hypothetical protein
MSRANRIARLVAIQQGTEFILLKHQQGKHDQATHGSWDTDRSNNKSDFKYPVQDAIDKVIKGEVGKVVPADAEFWLDKMADREDNPDLTNLEIVGTQLFTRDNLGIMRDEMPQVPYEQKDEFISEMTNRGIAVTREEVSPQKLHPIQAEISAKKSGKLARDIKQNGHGKSDGARIIVSSDNYIIDGHHRWAASAFLSFKDKGQAIPVLRVDMTHMELIDATLAWNKATGIESLSLDKSTRPFKKAWVEFELAVIKGILTTEMQKHLAGQHDQSSHGSWAGGETEFSVEEVSDEELYGVAQDYLVKGNFPTAFVGFENINGELSDKTKNEIFETVAELQTHFPVENMRIEFDEDEIKDYQNMGGSPDAVGFCTLGEGRITMSMLTALEEENSLWGGDPKRADSSTKYIVSVLAHEWGHAIDKRSQGKMVDDQLAHDQEKINRPNWNSEGQTNYGMTNTMESYADAFAEWFLSGGKTSLLHVKEMASKHGWDTGAFALTKNVGTRILVSDTFSTEIPPTYTILSDVTKHRAGQHDQSSHGSWATGLNPDVASDIVRFTQEWGGLSINMVDGSMPTTGYMVAKPPEFGTIVDAVDFNDPVKGPKILSDYMKRHKNDLGNGKNYLGTWLNEGKVYLDVSENIQSKSRATKIGRERNQLTIWDVANLSEIDTGGTGLVKKRSQDGGVEEHLGDDRRGDRRIRTENLGKSSGEKRLTVFVKPPVVKHQAGNHDQRTHGSWAGTTSLNAGSNLTYNEMADLKRNQSDTQVSQVYDAEYQTESLLVPDVPKPLDIYESPIREEFGSREDYLKAYKKYSNDWDKWSNENNTYIESDLATEHLDGTIKGARSYIESVINSEWFKEEYGVDGQIPRFRPEVKHLPASSRLGGRFLMKAGGKTFIEINKSTNRNEATILHEIAHYATTISQTNKHQGHGKEFATEYLKIIRNFAPKFAIALEDNFKKNGVSYE